MDFRLEDRKGRLVANGDMTIYQAASMKEALRIEWPTSNGKVSLDLAKVSELDTCGLQFILMLRRRAQADGLELAIVKPSSAVREVLDLCGLQDLYRAERKAA